MGVGFDGGTLWMEGLRFQRSTRRPLAPHQRERASGPCSGVAACIAYSGERFRKASGDRPANGYPHDPSYLVYLTILPGGSDPSECTVPRVYAPAGGAQGQRFPSQQFIEAG